MADDCPVPPGTDGFEHGRWKSPLAGLPGIETDEMPFSRLVERRYGECRVLAEHSDAHEVARLELGYAANVYGGQQAQKTLQECRVSIIVGWSDSLQGAWPQSVTVSFYGS